VVILVLVVGSTLIISAACSLFEAVLYSSRIVTLEAAAERRTHRHMARLFLDMKKDIASPTASILILNTIANTAGATIAGMYAAQILGVRMVPLFTIGLTLAILFFSELLPKTLGAMHWGKIWPFVVWPLAAMQKGLAPLVFLSGKFVSIFSRSRSGPPITEEEIQAMIRLGGKAGELTHGELRLISSVFAFDDMLTLEAMVPRRDVDFLDASKPWAESCGEIKRSRHTRYPLCDGGLDEVFGIVHLKDLVGVPEEAEFDLRSVVRPIRQVPETMPISRLMREMQRTRRPMALVVDEYGTNVGIVTFSALMEQLVGEIQDEFDAEAPDIVPEQAGQYSVDGLTLLSRINRELGCDLYSSEVRTISGLIVHTLDRLPKEGDIVELDNISAEVLTTEKGRARRIRLTLPKDQQEGTGH
jgi:CBS domain containing-hemolysin-like protein